MITLIYYLIRAVLVAVFLAALIFLIVGCDHEEAEQKEIEEWNALQTLCINRGYPFAKVIKDKRYCMRMRNGSHEMVEVAGFNLKPIGETQ